MTVHGLPGDWRQWPPKAKAKFLEQLRAMNRTTSGPGVRRDGSLVTGDGRRISILELMGFTEKQVLAREVADANQYTLYGGSRGPGKSYWLRGYEIERLLRWAAQGHRYVRVGMFCEDYPSLKDRQISKLARMPKWLGEVKSTQDDGLGFHLREEFGGGAILLRNLNDTTKYQSAEFAGIAVDELTRNPENVFDELRGSLRWPGIDDPFFVAATNPNGRFFTWVRKLWIEHDFPEHLQAVKDRFAYVPALPRDNPYLGADYWNMLDSLPARLRAAWRDGDWYVAAEGLVYDAFGSDNITHQEPELGLPFEIAVDDGYSPDPRAILFIQRRGSSVLVFDELYHIKFLEEQSIRALLDTCYQTAERLDPRGRTWPDPDGGMSNDALARALLDQGVPIPELAAVSHEAPALRRRLREANIPARNWLSKKVRGGGSTRAAAVTTTRELICDGRQHRPIQVHQRCRNLLDELTMGYKNKLGADGKYMDEPEDGNDHGAQALESWVWLRMGGA